MSTVHANTAADHQVGPTPDALGAVAITHSRTEGTLLKADTRLTLNGTTAISISPMAFRWSPNLKCWYLPYSRYKRHDAWAVETAAERLRSLGYEVTVDIDDLTPAPPFAQREADRADQAAARAERFAGYRDNATRRAQLADETAARLFGNIVDQPILIGHHSESAHRNRLKRAWKQIAKGAQERSQARYFETRAQASATQTGHRYGSRVTLRRIETLEAEARKLERTIAIYQVQGDVTEVSVLAYMIDLEQLHEEIGYWKAHIQALKESGEKIWTREDVPAGAFVSFDGEFGRERWYEVIRASAKSVTVPNTWGEKGTVIRKPAERGPQSTMGYDKIFDVATEEQLRERFGSTVDR